MIPGGRQDNDQQNTRMERLIQRNLKRRKKAEDLLSALRDLQVKSRQLTYFRLAFSATVVSSTLLFFFIQSQDFDPTGLLAAGFAVLLANLLALLLLVSRAEFTKFSLDFLNAVLLFVDIAALSYVVHVSQGLQSDLFFLYLLPILLASNVYQRLGTFLTAIFASAAYALTVVAENISFIPFLAGQGQAGSGSGLTAAYAQGLWTQLGSRSAVLFLVSMIWAAFCHRMSLIVQDNNLRLAEQLRANNALLDELKAQARREKLSSSISLALRHTLDLDTILSTTCLQLSEAVNAEQCLIISKSYGPGLLLWDSISLAGKNEKSSLPEELKLYFVEHSWRRKPETEPFNKILINDSPFNDEDLSGIRELLLSMNLCGILVRPILYGGELRALLAIFSFAAPRKWLVSELELIDAVAGQVAVACEQAELLAELSRANEDLMRKNSNLDAKNLELRQMQSQLIHQEKMASLGRIVAGIAHELNNPINFVHGNLPYLKEYFQEMKALIGRFEELPEEHKKDMQEALKKINYEFLLTDLDNIIADLQEGSERIRQIVRNLRSFSRLDEAELKEASVEEGIESTAKILSQYYGRDKIPIEYCFCALPPILCFPGKLNQVWMNLLANAAEALGANPDAKVIVRTELQPDSVLVSIEDNGPGISAGDQSKIFEPFYTTKPVGQGTGLGLSISHAIVERHSGKIWFETDPGSGTKFFVRLPLKLEISQELD